MKKVMIQFTLPGATLQQYDQAWVEIRAAGYSNPEGLLYHVGAQNGSTLLVVDIWESAEAFAKFAEFLGPIMARNGIPNVQPIMAPVHYEYRAD
jgi:hypothetical protein